MQTEKSYELKNSIYCPLCGEFGTEFDSQEFAESGNFICNNCGFEVDRNKTLTATAQLLIVFFAFIYFLFFSFSKLKQSVEEFLFFFVFAVAAFLFAMYCFRNAYEYLQKVNRLKKNNFCRTPKTKRVVSKKNKKPFDLKDTSELVIIFSSIALLVAIAGILKFYFMDTSVLSSGGGRVHNIGLINQREVGIFLTTISAILFFTITCVAIYLKIKFSNTVTCPFCYELIKKGSTICKYCKQFLQQ